MLRNVLLRGTKQMNRSAQNLLHLAILIAVALFFWMVAPKPVIQSHGILLPTKMKPRQPIAVNQVKVLGHVPAHYQDLGLIRITRHFDSTATKTQDAEEKDNILKARQLAAKRGANAIVVTMLGRSDQVGPLDGTSLYAKAIYVTK